MSDHESFEPIDSQVDLSSFDGEFETADAPSYDEVPDGKYQVKIQTAKLESSQKGDPMIKFDLVVISGSQAGRHIFKNSVITQASLPYVKGDLKTLGLELAKFSELAGRLDELLDKTLEVTKRTRGDYSNVYFNRRLNIEFLRRMESSPSRLMREAVLEALAVDHVLKGDMDAAKSTAEAFDREFGKNHQHWSIYRTITDDRVVKEPARLLAATQLALQQVPFDSKDYAAIAVKRAKLLGQTNPDQPLPAEWLEKLDQNPKLKYEVELAHAYGCWER